jgi:hypothetical protein
MTSPSFWAKVAAMFAIVAAVVGALLSAFRPRASLVAPRHWLLADFWRV